jgi:hypothetical protein
MPAEISEIISRFFLSEIISSIKKDVILGHDFPEIVRDFFEEFF